MKHTQPQTSSIKNLMHKLEHLTKEASINYSSQTKVERTGEGVRGGG